MKEVFCLRAAGGRQDGDDVAVEEEDEHENKDDEDTHQWQHHLINIVFVVTKSDLVYATAGVTSKGDCVSDKAMIKLRSDEEKNHYDNIICRKSRKILMTRMILGLAGVLVMMIEIHVPCLTEDS